MQFSEHWLNSLVSHGLASDRLGHLLTMAGLEVEALEPAAPAFTQVVVAEILSAERHPNADRLQVCQVQAGEGAPLTVVCGAPNARAGLRTACALVGASLPGIAIKQAKVRGVESFGMLCSAKELGIDENAAGIMELPGDAPVGASLRDYLALDDQRITLKLTPNRGDCLSVLGIAREVAALTGAPLVEPDCTSVPAALPDTYPVTLEAETACPRYCGRVIRGINPAAFTPDWMVRRLERSGLRPIHPVVDVTNYVLLELGQPMHGFDLAKLAGPVRARLAKPGEALDLLNGQRIELVAGNLVIADDSGPLALAGIMGGTASSVSTATTDIFLEAAHFTPDAVAGRARSHGLSTDSSHRFERGVDPELPARAMERATRLILDICGGQCGPVVNVGPGAQARPPVGFRPDRARRVIGFDLDDGAMATILVRLGMGVQVSVDGFSVTVPSHRFDITREVDLIEEVARVHGYDAIPAKVLGGGQVMLPAGEGVRTLMDLKNLLVARGYQENITYSFISEELDGDFRAGGESLPLLNPIASQMGVMRGSLLGGLVQALRHNLNHGQERMRTFEAGRAFLSAEANGQPRRMAALAYGLNRPEQWGEEKRHADFFDLRADLDALLYPRQVRYQADTHPALHPGQCARVTVEDVAAGWIGTLHPRLTQKYGFQRAPVLFEVDLDVLLARAAPRYQGMPRFPAVRRDLAVVVDAALPLGDIDAVLAAGKPALVSEITCFDVYQGQGIEAGKKSLAFKMLLQHTEKTLTDSEIEGAKAQVLELLTKRCNATLRG
ncbi:MAG: phenylalanine--tRNA ligase subunit beta [Pseudomonadota bacterium]